MTRTLALALMLVASPAVAQEEPPVVPCLPNSTMLDGLAQGFGEIPRVYGITNEGAIVTITGSEDGSWSLLIREPGHLTCLVLTGQGLEIIVMDEPS